MTDKLIVERQDGVVRLTLNRPDLLNALDEETVGAMYDLVDTLDRDPDVRVLVLTGNGRAFCAGADLGGGDVEPGSDAGRFLETHFNPLLEKMMALPIPVVSIVNGLAAGAGCSLALAADVTISVDSAYYLLAFVNIGLVPDVGCTWLLPRHIGRPRAAAMMLLGERIPAAQALEWGMIWQTAPADQLEAEAARIVDKLKRGPTRTYAMIRQGLRHAMESSLTNSLQRERVNQRHASSTADYAEGVNAFLGKRPAAFTGR